MEVSQLLMGEGAGAELPATSMRKSGEDVKGEPARPARGLGGVPAAGML